MDAMQAAAPQPVVKDPLAHQRRLNNEKMKKYFREHPDQAKKKSDRVLAKYHSHEAYRARVIERARERRLRLRATASETATASQITAQTEI